MENQKLSLLIQLVTGIAVLLGLGLVVWELQQTRQIAEGQMFENAYSLLIEDVRSILGEDFGKVFAKACIEPEELTDGEIFQMREYYEGVVLLIMRLKNIEATGVSAGPSWVEIAPSYVEYWLNSKVGRLHYEERVRRGLEPEIQQMAAEFLLSDLSAPCNDLATFIEQVRANE